MCDDGPSSPGKCNAVLTPSGVHTVQYHSTPQLLMALSTDPWFRSVVQGEQVSRRVRTEPAAPGACGAAAVRQACFGFFGSFQAPTDARGLGAWRRQEEAMYVLTRDSASDRHNACPWDGRLEGPYEHGCSRKSDGTRWRGGVMLQ